MHHTNRTLLDTGDTTPVLDTRLTLLAVDRKTALATARTLAAEVVSNVRTGRVTR